MFCTLVHAVNRRVYVRILMLCQTEENTKNCEIETDLVVRLCKKKADLNMS